MTFFRAVKRENPFVQVDKGFVNDPNITAKAKGILLYLLSKPDGWKIYEKDIVNHMKDGKDSIKSGIKELEEVGYITRERVRNKDGSFSGYNYTVYEVLPESPERKSRNGKTDNGKTDNGKPAHSNNNLSNNNLSNNESSDNEYIKDIVATDVDDIQNNKKSTTSKSSYKYDEQDMVLSKLLFKYIKQLDPKAKEPNFESWSNTVRLMRERDNRTFDEIKDVIVWCQNDSFWQGNILSTNKLRQQFSKLVIQKNKRRGGYNNAQSNRRDPEDRSFNFFDD